MAVPPGVQELLRQRLEPLPPPSRRVLEVAAVVGREFDLAPLASRARRAGPDALLDALAPALDAGIVREVTGALQRYAFTHALMRETVYSRLAPTARIALHAAVGAALEATGPRDDVERSALAHHFFEAAQGGDPAKAIRYACEAGERALDVLAFEEAVRHFERGLAAAATHAGRRDCSCGCSPGWPRRCTAPAIRRARRPSSATRSSSLGAAAPAPSPRPCCAAPACGPSSA